MTERHIKLAERVVDTFKTTLNPAALEQISDAQFEDLKMMIREAISEELGSVCRPGHAVLLVFLPHLGVRDNTHHHAVLRQQGVLALDYAHRLLHPSTGFFQLFHLFATEVPAVSAKEPKL